MADNAQPQTLLLVEDEALVAMQEARQLQKEGYAVVTAYSGEEAIAAVQAAAPPIDLILMDIDLGRGRMDGALAAQAILQAQDIPIVFLSSHTEPEIVARTEQITSYGYVVKNTGITVLAASIKMAFKLHAANHALREAKDYAENLISTANAMIVGLDTAGNLQVFNQAAERITGYTQAELQGKNWFEVLVPKERYPYVWAEFTRLMDGGIPGEFENPILTKSGEERLIMWQNIELRAQGKIVGTISFGIDITERRQAEESLRESEERLKFSQKVAHVGHWTWDTRSNQLTWSDEMYRIFGLDPEHFDGDLDKVVKQAIHPDDQEKVNAANQAVISENRPTPLEYRVIWPDQSVHTVWGEAGEKILDSEGRILKLSGIVQDITERKLAENAIRENEALLKTVTENTPDTILQVDSEGKITYANRLMTGLTQEEVIGSSIYKWVPEEQYPILTKVFENAFTKGESGEYESLGPGPNGESRVYYVRVRPVAIEGKTLKAIYTATDITERKRAEDALRQALADKDVLMRELQHRVKNSLAIIAGLVDLEEMNLTDEQARAIFANTRSRIESISAVYGQLYHSGDIDRVNLRHYLSNLVEGLSRSYLSSPGIVTIETQLEDVQLDVKRAMPLGIILNELVTNALKYAFPAGYAPDGGQGIIRVELLTSGGSIHLCVADNGVGFPAGKEHRTGTGLGLVEMLTRQLNGKLTIESAQGVTVRLIFDQT